MGTRRGAGQKNLLDLTRESGNVRRALRSNRGLNHELKMTFQHLASEQNLAAVSWRNRERIIHSHALHVLGPYRHIIARNQMDRIEKMNKERAASVVLPAITSKETQTSRPRSASNSTTAQLTDRRASKPAVTSQSRRGSAVQFNDTSSVNSDDDASDDGGQEDNQDDDLVKQNLFLGKRTRSISPYSSTTKTQFRPKSTAPVDPAVVVLEQKLDKFHLHLLDDLSSVNERLDSPVLGIDREADEESSWIDKERLSRLRNSLIVSVYGARLHVSARRRRQPPKSQAGPSWNELAAAMHLQIKPTPPVRSLTQMGARNNTNNNDSMRLKRMPTIH